MKQIIKILLINLILVSLSFAKINYYSNESADVILDIDTNKITFFAFGGSFDGKAEDFPINSILNKNEKGEYVGRIEDLYLSESNGYVYKMNNKIKEINIEINKDKLKINQLDCFETCPLFSNFLGIYIKKEEIPGYLIKIFSESNMLESNLLYSMKQQLLENKRLANEYLNKNNTNSSSQNPSLTLNQLLENAKLNKKVSIENLNEVLRSEEINAKNVQKYNDIAYYLQQANANDEAIFLLEKIIEKFPNRTVAYLNLGDAYNGINNKARAKVNYEKYIELMKKSGKEAKIPKRVLAFK